YRSKARMIDPAARICELELNKSVKFEKCLLATGASPIRYEGPGRGLEGIHYLRTLGDSDRIKRTTKEMNEITIIGGSFIGMELASCFAQRKIRTTVIHRASVPWNKLNNPDVSLLFKRYFERRGVRFVLEDEASGLIGTGRVNTVHTKKGRKISTDGVVVAIGVTPNTQIAEESRVTTGNGIVVNEFLETNIGGVFAAGDVANYYDPIQGKRRRVEHWDNAQNQGKTAGRNLAGAKEKYEGVSMFFSDVFDLSWEVWGDTEGADQVIQRGVPKEDWICSVYVRDDKISGIFLMGKATDESEAAKKLTQQHASIEGKYDILRNPSRELADLL
ncbi:MAG: FAD-dependent oxidoreductase, partial [Armatimonadota bacterium]